MCACMYLDMYIHLYTPTRRQQEGNEWVLGFDKGYILKHVCMHVCEYVFTFISSMHLCKFLFLLVMSVRMKVSVKVVDGWVCIQLCKYVYICIHDFVHIHILVQIHLCFHSFIFVSYEDCNNRNINGVVQRFLTNRSNQICVFQSNITVHKKCICTH